MTSEIDLNHTRTKRELFSASIAERVDAVAPVAVRAEFLRELESMPVPETEERAGRSVSASAVGDECARRIQLGIWPTFHPSTPTPRKLPLDDKTKRIFARGHATETKMAEWLQAAGFDLVTRTPEEFQFGFTTAGGQIKGFADGLLRDLFVGGAATMVMWEHKTISAKNHRAVAKHGVLKQYPKYDAQVQMLMAYLELPATLFSFLNAETGDLFFELHAFNPQRAQLVSDRAVWILRATRAGELLPKAGADSSTFCCRYCDFREECWS